MKGQALSALFCFISFHSQVVKGKKGKSDGWKHCLLLADQNRVITIYPESFIKVMSMSRFQLLGENVHDWWVLML